MPKPRKEGRAIGKERAHCPAVARALISQFCDSLPREARTEQKPCASSAQCRRRSYPEASETRSDPPGIGGEGGGGGRRDRGRTREGSEGGLCPWSHREDEIAGAALVPLMFRSFGAALCTRLREHCAWARVCRDCEVAQGLPV